MEQLAKVLVPIDFSEHSERALSFAAEFARCFGAHVRVVHVYPASAYVAPPLIPGPVVVGQFRDQSQRALDAFLEKAERQHELGLSGLLLEGVPHVEIIRAAKDEDADMIIMGTHGRTGIEHLLLGSVAERVIRGSEVPVITVPLSK